MSYITEIIRRHESEKSGFGAHYEFDIKQRDILHLARTDLQTTEKKKSKTEWHIKKTKRDIDKLRQHLVELESRLGELIRKEEGQYNFLQAALSVKESDIT